MRTSTFTSYINVEPDQAIDAKFAALERQAQSTFNKIAQHAAKANTAMSGGRPGGLGGSAIGGASPAVMAAQARALRDVAQQNQRVSTEVGRTTQKMGETAVATARAKREMSGFERTLRTTATTLNVVQGPLGPMAGRVGALAAAVGELTGFRLGLAGTGAALFALTSQANKYTEVRSKLVPLFEAQNDVNKAMRETVRIANDSRTGLAPVVDLYSRLTLAGRDFGISQQRVSRLTEIASKAAKLSGGMQVSQDAGLYQFAQGIGSGTLAGDELKSIRENTLRLAKAIADGMGVPIGKLKELGKEGKLTPKIIADALEKESARIDAELERLPETLASASSKFSNALTVMVGESDQALGFTTALAEGLAFLAENLNTVANAAIGLGVAFAVFKSGTYVRDMAQRIEQTQRIRTETLAAARAEVTAATQQRTAAAQRITQLRSVRAELQQQLVAERAVRNEALATARTAQQKASTASASMRFYPSVVETKRYQDAMVAARNATANLNDAQSRLRQINTDLSRATGTMTTQTTRYRSATAAASAAAVSFGSRLRGLIGAINPLGITLSLAISFLIQLAFRKDAAARAADAMADAEANLGRFIDLNTGKIIQQNKALLANERLKSRERLADARDAWKSERAELAAGVPQGYLGMFGAKLPGSVRADLAQYQSGKIDLGQLTSRLEAQRNKSSTSVQKRIDDVISKAGSTAESARVFQQAAAQDRLLTGKPLKGDLALAQGFVDPTGGDIKGSAAGGGGGVPKAAGDRKKLGEESKKAAEEERRLQKVLDLTDKRADVLSRYDDAPKALDRAAKDARELAQLVGQTMNGLAKASKDNPLGEGIYTAEMAAADKARIDYGVRKPMRDLLRDQERALDLGELRVAGYEAEAAALEKALSIQDDIGRISRDDYEQILRNEQAQLRINDALESRGRITSLILGQAQEARDIVEGILMGDTSIAGGIKQAMNNIARIEVRKLTETLFAGTDEKLREMLRGQSGVEGAVGILEKNAARGGTAVGDHATAVEQATARIKAATAGMTDNLVGAPTTAASGSDTLVNTLKNATAKGTTTGMSSALKSISKGADGFSFLGGFGGFNSPSNDNESYDPNAEIVVTATKAIRQSQKATGGALPTGAEVYNQIGEAVGGKLDKALGTKFFKGIGGQLGTALQGAGTGMMASSFAKALGIKQSKTGAAIGGGIGGMISKATGIPGLDIVGGLLGGTLGGMLKKTPRGSATIGAGANGNLAISSTQGNSQAAIKAGSGAADATISSLTQVAKQLGGGVNAAIGSVSIGKSGDSWHVDPTGRGRLKKSQGGIDFDDDYEAAVAFAMQTLIKQGVITGISQASQNILAAGKDLQASLEKATLIESIPKRLMALQDPVRYAVTELNREFNEMIAALKEGGATAGQFADAQKLYDLERARAIEQATAQSTAAIQAYLDEMVGGQSSPLNKSTVYGNASTKFGSTVADFKAGKADQNELLTAAKNFQDASRSLFGSGAGFFSDFDAIKAALTGAKGSVGTGADLPGSPFATDTAVQNAINSLNGTTAQQTATLNGTLQQILAQLVANDNGTGGIGGGSSLNYLPGVLGRAGRSVANLD